MEEKPTTVSIYPADVAKLKAMRPDDQRQADQLAAIVADYERRRSMTKGQSAAADTIDVIKATMVKICEMVEGAAQEAAVESAAVREHADVEVARAKGELERERTERRAEVEGLKARLAEAREASDRLPAALAEAERLGTRLDAAEAARAKAEEARDGARASENAAKARLADIQSELTEAVKRASDARALADGLKARLAEAEMGSKLAAKDAEGREATLTAERDAARREAEEVRAQFKLIADQAEDLRRQLADARARMGGGR